MLSHKYRFHGHGSLRYLYRNGRAARTRHLMLRYTPNKNRVHSRVAVVVSKKVMKSAVGRNRIRRRLFEVIREMWPQVADAYDISLTVYSAECMTMSYDELKSQVHDVFAQAGLYKD